MRVRLVAARIQFEFMVDDGDTLQPLIVHDEDGNAGPVNRTVMAKDWPEFCESGLGLVTAELQAMLAEQHPTEAAEPSPAAASETEQ